MRRDADKSHFLLLSFLLPALTSLWICLLLFSHSLNVYNNYLQCTTSLHPVLAYPCSLSPCFVIVPLLCHRPLLCHHPPTLSSSPCSVIVPLFCHRPPALSSSPCSVIVPLFCHRPPAISRHCPSSLSKSSCFVIVLLLCHRSPPLSSFP